MPSNQYISMPVSSPHCGRKSIRRKMLLFICSAVHWLSV